VRSHVGGSGDDSEQSDNHESGNPSMLGHGNPSVPERSGMAVRITSMV
jgi:hypothetical protein